MTKQLGFAVIGCGRMGKRRIQSVLDDPRTKLVCIADVLPLPAGSELASLPCPFFDNYRQVVDHPDVDVVVISVPNRWHREMAVAAMKAKKHVFCEKPLAQDPEEARLMVETARENGVTLKVGSNLRFFKNVLQAKELLDQGAIGETLFVRSWIGHSGWNVGTWFSEKGMAGGGTFLDNGCHIMDVARWFVGDMKSAVGVVKTQLWDIKPLEDNGIGIFESVSGKTVLIHSSWTEWAGYMYMEIYGAKGYIRIDNRGKKSTLTLGNTKAEEKVFDYSAEPPTSFNDEFKVYVANLLEGKTPTPTGEDGLKTVEMAWAVYESAGSGQKVELGKRTDTQPV